MKVGRNEPCPCGSGKKYKHCHGVSTSSAAASADPQPVSLAPVALGQIVALVNSGRLQEADNQLQRMLRENPSDPQIYYYAGVVAFQLGDPDRSLGLLRKSGSFDDTYVDAFHALGIILLELRRLEEAAEAFERVLTLAPGMLDALVNLGSIQVELGNIDGGTELLKRALSIDDNQAHLNNNLGVLYQKSGHFAEAATYLSKAVAQEPGNFDYRSNLARNLFSMGMYNAALEEYRAAVDLNNASLPIRQEFVDCLSRVPDIPFDGRTRADILSCLAIEELDLSGLTRIVAKLIKQAVNVEGIGSTGGWGSVPDGIGNS